MKIELTEQELNNYWATQIKDQLMGTAKAIQKNLHEKPGIEDCFDEDTRKAVQSFVIDFAGSIIVQK